MDENPYIFLKNNLLLQFLIADRYHIYRHITACVSLLLFFLITKEWGHTRVFLTIIERALSFNKPENIRLWLSIFT